MSALYKNSAAAAADVSDRRQRCSCLPFCFWRGGSSSRSNRRTMESSRGADDAPGKKRHRRRRFRLIRLSWLAFSWPCWLRKSGRNKDCTKTTTGKKKQRMRGRRLLLLLKTSLQADKMLASVVSGDSSGLLPATVSSFGDAKKQNRIKPPRPTADGAATGGTRQPQQASTTGAGTRGSTAAPAARPGTSQPCKTRTTDEPAMAAAGRVWRAPSRRHSLHQPVRAERPAGLWTAATTLGVIVLLGRVTAVVFLCSCLYGARFVRAWAARGASAKNSGGVAGASASSSRRFGDPVGVAAEKGAELCVTEECKKKVVMAGLLERPGNRPSSRFGR